MFMRRNTNVNINEMMFHTMSHPLRYTQDKNITYCSSLEYMLVLRRSRIASVFHTVFGYENVKVRKEKRSRGYIDERIKIEESSMKIWITILFLSLKIYSEKKETYL